MVGVTRNKWKNIEVVCNACNRFMGEFGNVKGTFNQMRIDLNSRLSHLELKVNQNTAVDSIRSSIASLESAVKDLISNINVYQPNTVKGEFGEILQELGERKKRKRNFIMFGLPETNNGSREERSVSVQLLLLL